VSRLPKLTDHAGLLGVIAAEAAFTDGDDWLDAVLRRLSSNRALLGKRLAAELLEIDWTPPGATYLAWLDCRRLARRQPGGDLSHPRPRCPESRARLRTRGRRLRSPQLRHKPEHLVETVRRMRHGADTSEHLHTDRLSEYAK
jgi:hypothetical protein